jgi:hypothetical protein
LSNTPAPLNGTSIVFVVMMAGVGVAIGCALALICMIAVTIAANPWVTILVIGALYGVMGLLIDRGKV